MKLLYVAARTQVLAKLDRIKSFEGDATIFVQGIDPHRTPLSRDRGCHEADWDSAAHYGPELEIPRRTLLRVAGRGAEKTMFAGPGSPRAYCIPRAASLKNLVIRSRRGRFIARSELLTSDWKGLLESQPGKEMPKAFQPEAGRGSGGAQEPQQPSLLTTRVFLVLVRLAAGAAPFKDLAFSASTSRSPQPPATGSRLDPECMEAEEASETDYAARLPSGYMTALEWECDRGAGVPATFLQKRALCSCRPSRRKEPKKSQSAELPPA
uniref:Uncharacterized protein n=1 Tax=Sphaerodactylus townsendi TaxID=933632 RepID=A0ACB8EWD0_9SAUR